MKKTYIKNDRSRSTIIYAIHIYLDKMFDVEQDSDYDEQRDDENDDEEQQQEDTDAQVHSDSGRKTGVSTVGLKRKVHEGGNNAGLHNVSKRQRTPDNSFGRTTGKSSRHDSESEDLTSEEKRAIKQLEEHSLVGYLQRNRGKSAAILRFWDEVVESRSVSSCNRNTGMVGTGSNENQPSAAPIVTGKQIGRAHV